MILYMQRLLRLPPCLRQQVLLDRSVTQCGRNARDLATLQKRTFGSSITRQAQRAKTSPIKPTRKGDQSHPAPTRTQNIVPPAAPPISNAVFLQGKLSLIAPALERVLLYRSPNHGLFFTVSWLVGASFLVGGYSYAQMFLKDKPGQKPNTWWIKSLGAVSVLVVVIFGTNFLLAPTKLIKSIAIVPSMGATATFPASGTRILRLEIKRPLGFKPDVLETVESKIYLDRNIPVTAEDITFVNVPKTEAQSFTESYFSKQKSPNKGVAATLQSANRSLLSIWPAMKREVRRMFLRDQMVYVRVEGNGSFKLDLQNCQLLDEGRPLHRVMRSDEGAAPSIAAFAKNLFKG